MCVSGSVMAEPTLAEYLETRDAPCPGCFRNLRGQFGPRCPACEKRLYFGETRALHHVYGDARTSPMPVSGSPGDIAKALCEHLKAHDHPCPSCGYNLRGISSDVCPECGLRLLESSVIDVLYPPRRSHAETDLSFLFGLTVAIVYMAIMLFSCLGSFGVGGTWGL